MRPVSIAFGLLIVMIGLATGWPGGWSVFISRHLWSLMILTLSTGLLGWSWRVAPKIEQLCPMATIKRISSIAFLAAIAAFLLVFIIPSWIAKIAILEWIAIGVIWNEVECRLFGRSGENTGK